MLERYQISENIPIAAYLADGNGNPETGMDVRVTIIDLADPANPLLDHAVVAETAQAGYYFLDWAHGFATPKRLIVVTFEIVNNKDVVLDVKKVFVDDLRSFLEEKIDQADGAAV